MSRIVHRLERNEHQSIVARNVARTVRFLDLDLVQDCRHVALRVDGSVLVVCAAINFA